MPKLVLRMARVDSAFACWEDCDLCTARRLQLTATTLWCLRVEEERELNILSNRFRDAEVVVVVVVVVEAFIGFVES